LLPQKKVGNKCDLEDEREVKKEEGEQLAAQFNCPFFETSAKDHVNVDECFRELVREVRRAKEKEVAPKDTGSGKGESSKPPKPKSKGCILL
jgi:GTPase KRas protein